MRLTKLHFHALFSFLSFLFLSQYTVTASAFMDKMEEEDKESFYTPSMDYPLTFSKSHKWRRAKATEERRDLTGLPFMTIDPEGAKDLDDALYVEEDRNGSYHIAIAIADPTHYIQPLSPVAKEARRRSFTSYGYAGPIPMLPPKLAQACSLEQGKNRPALIVDLYIDKHGNFQDTPIIYRALIRSQNRLSYGYANSIFEGKWFGAINPDLKKRLSLTQKAAQALKAYYSEDWEIMSSQEIVSEFMTTANNAAAIVLKKRIEESMIEKAVFRSQSDVGERALYSSKSSFHASFDLTYTHFTSPIRRYADIMVHWLLFHHGYEFAETTLEYLNRQQGQGNFLTTYENY